VIGGAVKARVGKAEKRFEFPKGFFGVCPRLPSTKLPHSGLKNGCSTPGFNAKFFSSAMIWRRGSGIFIMRLGLIMAVWLAGLLGGAAGNLFAAAEPPNNIPNGDVAWLRSGERLRGQIVSMDGQGQLLWRHQHIAEEVALPLRDLLKIRLGPRPVPADKPAHPCLVRLINGDELVGNLAGFDGESLRLETWFSGEIKINRNAMDSLLPLVINPKMIFQGLTSLEGWTLGDAVVPTVQTNAWFYSDGALVSLVPGSIARDVKLPEAAQIDFDLSWEGYTQLAVALYADSLQPIQLLAKDEGPDFGGFYSLQMLLANVFSANLLPVKKGLPINVAGLGAAYLPTMIQQPRAHITIRVSKRERKVYLEYNGTLVRQWQDPMETLGPGTAMRFVNQGPGSLRLSGLVISEWDGRLDLRTNVVNNLTNDVVNLLNQDQVTGTITSLRDDALQISAPFGAVTVPMNRIEQLHFARQGRAQPVTGSVRAGFAQRGRLSVQLDGWENNVLLARHPLLGKLRISAAAVRQLEWGD
jgi:hypothetical protein